jgi:hypothetical protein
LKGVGDVLFHRERYLYLSRVAPPNTMKRIRDYLRSSFVRSNKRAGTNFIVVRHSPDWLSIDPESSRAFCVKLNVPETLIIDFMAFWNAAVAVDFHRCRPILMSRSLPNPVHRPPSERSAPVRVFQLLYRPVPVSCLGIKGRPAPTERSMSRPPSTLTTAPFLDGTRDRPMIGVFQISGDQSSLAAVF